MFKFKVSDASIAKLEAQIKSDVKQVLATPAVLNECGQFLSERLRYQTRITKPFNETKDLPLLKDKTILNRIYLLKYNTPHPVAEEGLSNLTLTGKLLDSLSWEIEGPGLVAMVFKGIHPRYKGAKGQPIGKSVPNADLARWLFEKGFTVFDQSISENKIVRGRINTIVKRYLRRALRIRDDLRNQN